MEKTKTCCIIGGAEGQYTDDGLQEQFMWRIRGKSCGCTGWECEPFYAAWRPGRKYRRRKRCWRCGTAYCPICGW